MLQAVAHIGGGKELDAKELENIEKLVYVVTALQSERLINYSAKVTKNLARVAGLPELLRAYGAERAWARVCAALRGALHEAPPLEGLEPLALPLPGGEAEVRRMLLEPHSLHPST